MIWFAWVHAVVLLFYFFPLLAYLFIINCRGHVHGVQWNSRIPFGQYDLVLLLENCMGWFSFLHFVGGEWVLIILFSFFLILFHVKLWSACVLW